MVTRIFPILIWVLLSQWPVFAQQDAELRLRRDGAADADLQRELHLGYLERLG